MSGRWTKVCHCTVAIVLAVAHRGSGQDPAIEDQAIETIRQLPQISPADQRRIGEWVQAQVDKLVAARDDRQAAAATFRKSLKTQFENPANSQPFRAQLAAQTAQVAVARLAAANLDRWVAFALARVLVDFNHAEGLPGLLAGLRSPEESVRYLCADGLAALRPALASDKASVGQVVAALRQAGLGEASPIVLSRIYVALAYPVELATVFDAYLAILEKRLTARRTVPAEDGAEVEAYEFFRNSAVLGAMTPDQKAKLAAALAVFLRLDAERYGAPGLRFNEIDRLERSLDAIESILVELAGPGKGGKIRDEIAAGGHENHAKVLAEAYKWFGNPAGNEPAALNAAPFNVPVGAP